VIPHPWGVRAGAAIALATLVCARRGGLRLVLTVTALGAAVVAGAITITGQMTHHYAAGGFWPSNFPDANIVASAAFLALAGDAIVELVRTRAAARWEMRLGAVQEPQGPSDEQEPPLSEEAEGGEDEGPESSG
jgi:uncharacterized protein YqfA (UPF0365 family)